MKKGFESINIHGCANAVVPVPAIGENGNWFIGNDDTGVSVQGPKGEAGEMGQQGPKGEQGEIGPAGPQGIQGIQGEKGEKGDAGEKGELGLKGDKGDAGASGVQGPKGDRGEKGDEGPQGPKGDTPELAMDLTTAIPGKALDASMGYLLNNSLIALGESVADGKALIASAITSKGVVTAGNASFQNMATNINAIKTSASVTAKALPYTAPQDQYVILFSASFVRNVGSDTTKHTAAVTWYDNGNSIGGSAITSSGLGSNGWCTAYRLLKGHTLSVALQNSGAGGGANEYRMFA